MVAGWWLPEQREKVDKIKMKLVAAFVLLHDFSARIISEITERKKIYDKNGFFLDKNRIKLVATFVLLI